MGAILVPLSSFIADNQLLQSFNIAPRQQRNAFCSFGLILCAILEYLTIGGSRKHETRIGRHDARTVKKTRQIKSRMAKRTIIRKIHFVIGIQRDFIFIKYTMNNCINAPNTQLQGIFEGERMHNTMAAYVLSTMFGSTA